MSTRPTVVARRRPLRAIADWVCVLVAGSCLWGLAFTAVDVVLRVVVHGGTSWPQYLPAVVGRVVVLTVLVVAAWRSTSWYAAQVARAYARA